MAPDSATVSSNCRGLGCRQGSINKWKEGQSHNLWGPGQNENAGPLVQKARRKHLPSFPSVSLHLPCCFSFVFNAMIPWVLGHPQGEYRPSQVPAAPPCGSPDANPPHACTRAPANGGEQQRLLGTGERAAETCPEQGRTTRELRLPSPSTCTSAP